MKRTTWKHFHHVVNVRCVTMEGSEHGHNGITMNQTIRGLVAYHATGETLSSSIVVGTYTNSDGIKCLSRVCARRNVVEAVFKCDDSFSALILVSGMTQKRT